jgi:uncharacterized surface protein with fasciclin (FAS1) repeats
MKTRIFSSAIFVPFAVLLFLITSCDKDDDDVQTVAGLISDQSGFTTLNTAIIKGGLTSKLNGTEQLTFFAPNNDAFAAAGITTTVLDGLSSSDVSKILYYHILPSKILAADVPAGPNARVLTYNGDSVYVTRNANGVFVNGIRVDEADMLVSNGVVHKLSTGVLMPPAGNLLATATAAGLDSMVKAINYVSTGPGGDPTTPATLADTLLTIFAPTNAAFTSLLTDLGLKDISQIPMATLLATLKHHAIQGRYFSSDLTNTTLTMVSGGKTVINIPATPSTAPTISGFGNGTNTAKIIKLNIIATNGVIHLIDKVIIP